MRLINFLNEGRSRTIFEDQAMKIVKRNCKQAVDRWKKGYKIFRAIDERDDFMFIKPRSGDMRRSRNTSNYYTLFMNNHENWSEYPKRQIICAGGSGERAFTFARSASVYHVLPFDNAKIGICPTADIWDSFDTLREEYDLFDLSQFNQELEEFGIPDNSYRVMRIEAQNTQWDRGTSIWDVMEKFLDPDVNNFRVMPIRNYNVGKDEDVEVWTDAPCVLINHAYMPKLNKLFEEWGM